MNQDNASEGIWSVSAHPSQYAYIPGGSETLDSTSRSDASGGVMGAGYGVAEAINQMINEDDDDGRDADGRPVLTRGAIKKLLGRGGHGFSS